jgi:hypothetical protein
MQKELDAELGAKVQLLGVNGIGQEAGNPSITANRTIPWLQDTASEAVWASWNVTYRDVVVLDGENRPVAIYNVTSNNLGIPENYAALKQILLDAAAKLP